ncbi:MAG: PAS domain-containing protein, partial [Proteobacteria bacterium]|nr:PAS domain-containing protein [Pseudomonadota bacterium]
MRAQAIHSGISVEATAALDQLATGIAILDAAPRIIHANPAFVELTGLVHWRGCPLEVLGDVAATLSAAIARLRLAQGAIILRGLALPMRNTTGVVDVAVSHCAAGVLLELHACAPQEMTPPAPISHSLRGLAHEVKNPLAGVRGAAQLLHRRAGEPDQQRLARLIIAEADRLGALTDRLLHPSGKPHLAMLNLHEVAERARALVAVEASPELRLERDYDPSLPGLRGDADRLQQLLL